MDEKEYIERGALMVKLVRKFYPVIPTGSIAEHICTAILDTINNQCAADVVEVRHGEWIPNTLEEHGEQFPYEKIIVTFRPLDYRCSLCGRIEEFKEPYCHCGAKMDGKK